ncbi:MAG: efflux RND transporter permease subunit [Bdellovibrio bacteriovorus]
MHGAEDIAGTVVGLRGGVPVRIADLGDVRIGPAMVGGTASANGHPAVLLAIQKQTGVNTLDLTERLDLVLSELQEGLPAGMRIEIRLFRQADFIQVAEANVEAALRDGAILVVIIVFAFPWSLSGHRHHRARHPPCPCSPPCRSWRPWGPASTP